MRRLALDSRSGELQQAQSRPQRRVRRQPPERDLAKVHQHIDQRRVPVPQGELQQAVRLHGPQREGDKGSGQQACGRVGEQRRQSGRQGVADQPVGALGALGQGTEERVVGLGGNRQETRASSHRLPGWLSQGEQYRSLPGDSLIVPHTDSNRTRPKRKDSLGTSRSSGVAERKPGRALHDVGEMATRFTRRAGPVKKVGFG